MLGGKGRGWKEVGEVQYGGVMNGVSAASLHHRYTLL